MQTPSMITFHCPSCGMKLQVPAQMAGVAGPCPQCSATITAPSPNAQMAAGAPPAAVPQAPQPTPQQQPQQVQQQPAYQQPAPQHNIPQSIPQQQPVSLRQQPETQQAQPSHPALGAARSDASPPIRHNSPSSAGSAPEQAPRSSAKRDSLPRHIEPPKAQRNWMRVIFPLAFLVVAAITVLVVLQAVGIYEIYDFSKLRPDNTSSTTPTKVNSLAEPTGDDNPNSSVGDPAPSLEPPTTGSPEGTIPVPVSQEPKDNPVPGEFPELQLPPPSTDPADGSTVPVDVTPAEPPGEEASTPSADPAPAISPEEKSPPTAGSRAYQTLSKFLEAKTLGERLPLMSKSQLSQEQLEASCLARPIGLVKSKRLAEMVPRSSDGMIQYLYFVSFEDKAEPQMRHRIVVQLVERPGVHPPRVHGDAFIEHYEKKFSTYGMKPGKGVTTFHCIAEVRTSDLAKNIPEEIKKETVRFAIKTNPHGDAMFDAFLNKNSPLMDKVGPRKEFPYAESRFCILSFRWNTDNPEKPYVELNDIVASGWER